MTDTTEKPAEAPVGLYKALSAFQGEVHTLNLGKTGEGQIAGNKDYKYLTLDKLMGEALPLLSKHGLAWMTFPGEGPDGPVLHYTLAHVGGDSLTGTFPLMLDKQNSQGLGSAITYGRRYSFCSVVGLTPDPDDDGAKASETEKTKAVKKKDPEEDRPVTDEELTTLLTAVKAKGANIDLLLASVGAEDTPSVGQAREIFRRLNA